MPHAFSTLSDSYILRCCLVFKLRVLLLCFISQLSSINESGINSLQIHLKNHSKWCLARLYELTRKEALPLLLVITTSSGRSAYSLRVQKIVCACQKIVSGQQLISLYILPTIMAVVRIKLAVKWTHRDSMRAICNTHSSPRSNRWAESILFFNLCLCALPLSKTLSYISSCW